MAFLITTTKSQNQIPVSKWICSTYDGTVLKFKGEFVWHHHEVEDELFLVVKGKLVMHFRDRNVSVEEGEFIVVPAGVDHKPEAEGGTHVILFEPNSTLNTGNVRNERTLDDLERV